MEDIYREITALVEHVHRQFLEAVKLVLDAQGLQDINSVQALMLFSIGDFEMTMSEVALRGGHIASNATYNVRRMAEAGYLHQERSVHDRRSTRVRLTEKGAALCREIALMHEEHLAALAKRAVTVDDLTQLRRTLERLERLWLQLLESGARGMQISTAA